ncbi:hypothetical protein AN958_03886 [Leucoagaricus sp. SymC.cos]|nr:hypothetical protein AN958_03886 [Leucoagaricus sp. SymC.cos]
MPPTIPNSPGHPIPKSHAVSRALAGSRFYLDRIPDSQTVKLNSALFSRNFSTAEGEQQAATTTISDTTLNTFTPYPPSADLHPSIVASSTGPDPSVPPGIGLSSSSHTRPHVDSFVIIIAFSAVFASLFCVLCLIMLARWLKLRIFSAKIFHGQCCFRRGKKSGRDTPIPEEPVVFVGVDYTDGNALVHDTTVVLDLERKCSKDTVVGSLDGPPRIPPSIISAESLTLHPDYSTPTMTGFQERVAAEEADISMAIGIAMRDCTYSGSDLSSMNHGVPKLSGINERNGSWKLKSRTRQGSDASDSTEPTTESDVFSIAATTRSSLTSIVEVAHDSELEELDIEEAMEMEMEMEADDIVFEVARAQAQSMEFKRGVLVDWSAHRASLSPILEEPEITVRFNPPSPSLSFATVPSLVVTCPSMMTIPIIRPSFSSVSVDLNEFPLPPSAFHYDKVLDEFEMCMPLIQELDSSRADACSVHL